MNKSEMFWQTYLNLEKELLDISKYIYITDEINDNQLKTYSPYIADLLVKTCIEIEAISKELYFDFKGEKLRGDKTLMFDTDCLKLIDIKCETHKKIVMITCSSFNITKQENKVFKPLKEAHKQQGTDWERAYQAVKHDRYASISKGTINNLIHAMGALYLLNIYNRKIKIDFKFLDFYKIDLSFGSSIFSVKNPNSNYVDGVINNKEFSKVLKGNESPFVYKYTSSSYKNIVQTNEEINELKVNFINNQPEMKDPEFITQLHEEAARYNDNPENQINIYKFLCIYRINKKIPKELPYIERKKLLVNSPEWKNYIRNRSNTLSENEITDLNIQSEINNLGSYEGLIMEVELMKTKLQKALNEAYCELVLDTGEIKYK